MVMLQAKDKVQWEREYYQDGSLMWETPYVNGQENGVEKGYYRDGTLWWKTEYYYGLDIYQYLGDKQW